MIEAATTSDVDPLAADTIAQSIDAITEQLKGYRNLSGVVAHAKAYGSYPVANHEMLCVGGASHPMSPGLRHWFDGEKVYGSVTFNWSYEGPPNHVHGGWVAAILDHFMGMAQGMKLQQQAAATRIEGRARKVAADIGAFTTVVNGISSYNQTK